MDKKRSLKEELGEYQDCVNIEDDDSFIKICDLYLHDIMFEPATAVEYRYLGYYHVHINKDYDKAKKYYEIGISYGDDMSMFLLGNFFEKFTEDDNHTNKYYLMAMQHGNVYAMDRLGVYYGSKKKYEKAQKYFLMAIDHNSIKSIHNLAVSFFLQGEHKKAKKYFLMAIERGEFDSTIILANLYSEKKKYNVAEKYYRIAFEGKSNLTCVDFIEFYENNNNYDNAKRYHLMNINCGLNHSLHLMNDKDYVNVQKYYMCRNDIYSYAMFCLANILEHKYVHEEDIYENNSYEDAKRYYLMAIEYGCNDAIIRLAGMLGISRDYKDAERYYLMAIDNGCNDAILELATMYNFCKDYENAERYYLIAINKGINDAILKLAAFYEKKEDYANAESQFLAAIECGLNDAVYQLASFFKRQQDHKNAKRYFSTALQYENNRRNARKNLKCCCKNVTELLKIYIKNSEFIERTKIIKSISKIWNSRMNDKEVTKFIEIVSKFEFHTDDDIPTLLKVFINLYIQKIDIIELHFKYTVEGKGFNEAKEDFVNLINRDHE